MDTTLKDHPIKTLYNILDNNRELIEVAHKGYLDKISELLQAEDVQRSKSWIKQALKYYRVINDCPLKYRDDKYYKSQKKGNLQEK